MLLAIVLAATSAPLTASDQTAIKKSLSGVLLDAESARWRWPKPVSDIQYCGWVNAKNALGAYTGFRQFYIMGVKDNRGKYEVFDVKTDPQLVAMFCAKAGHSTTEIPEE